VVHRAGRDRGRSPLRTKNCYVAPGCPDNFYNRKWKPAVAAAVRAGLPRRPRIHDLRHTHVAWLVAANIPLPAIQARRGHESIQAPAFFRS
jgi:integrase